MAEYPPTREQPFGERPLTLHDLRLGLQKAAVDKRIDRVVLELGLGEPGWASIEELRQEIATFRARRASACTRTATGSRSRTSTSRRPATPSAAADDSWILFSGVNGEREFHKGLMDKLGVVMRVHKIEKYKAAGEIDIRTDMSPEARDNAQWILDATMQYVVPKILARPQEGPGVVGRRAGADGHARPRRGRARPRRPHRLHRTT